MENSRYYKNNIMYGMGAAIATALLIALTVLAAIFVSTVLGILLVFVTLVLLFYTLRFFYRALSFKNYKLNGKPYVGTISEIEINKRRSHVYAEVTVKYTLENEITGEVTTHTFCDSFPYDFENPIIKGESVNIYILGEEALVDRDYCKAVELYTKEN